ncbi:hypothetical protein [Silvibacterium acidisoli]|uniref:hypothetical protein n=1 Tax=Acidobacteriaceae bacterium ZG23-2 TaxID=2883246 RepID=UPI00406CEE11
MLIKRTDQTFTPPAGISLPNVLPFPMRLNANLVAWYAADQSVVQSGGSVSSLTDLSGNGITLTKSASAVAPIAYVANGQNGLPYIQNQQANNTSATATWLESAADIAALKWDYTQPFTAAFAVEVMNFATDASPHLLMGFNEPSHSVGWNFFTEYGSSFQYTVTETNGSATSSVNSSLGTRTASSACSLIFTYDGSGNTSGSKLYVNGALFATGTSGALNGSGQTQLLTGQKLHLLGGLLATENCPDKFFEGFLANRVLTATEAGYLDQYFNNKWALHP